MHIVLYGIIALAGWCIGYALGASWASWVIAPCLAIAGLSGFTLAKTPHLVLPNVFAAKSVAHRAWFSSSWATLGAIVVIWLSVGWSLPGLNVGGLRLDPAGALGWTQDWLDPRRHLVLGLLAGGLIGMFAGVASWLWQKRAGKKPVVVALWALAPFFWMATLGLLVGITQPWRQASTHEMATQWNAGIAVDRLPEFADIALKKAQTDPTAGVWAHAIAIRTYQAGVWDRRQLDGYLQVLAQYNRKRTQVPLLPASGLVGIERMDLCVANMKRDGKGEVDAQKACSQEPLGRAWDWKSK